MGHRPYPSAERTRRHLRLRHRPTHAQLLAEARKVWDRHFAPYWLGPTRAGQPPAPTATVHLDNSDARFVPAPASDSEDDPPVQCWHYEPGTPCDWDVCRQPERLANGDTGTDPAQRP